MAGSAKINQSKRVELILQQMDSLPTLSPVVVRLLEVTADERSDAADVIELVSADLVLIHHAGMLTEKFRPHVLLLDYLLPDVNGNLVCDRIRSNADLNETKIIIISGVVNQDEIDTLLRSGADDFVKKPFNIDKLIERMSLMLDV